MKIYDLNIAAAIAIIFLSQNVLAASHNKLVYIDEYDTNGDFAVSERELDVVRQARFSYTDTDNNGVVNESEYVAEYSARLNAKMGSERIRSIKQSLIRFDSIDENDDRKIVWGEILSSGDSNFNHFDGNKDGVIDDKDSIASEFSSTESSKEDSEEIELKQRERLLSSAKRALRMTSTHTRHGMMQKYDTDKKGVITREDYDHFRKNVFDASDKNNDQSLSKEEFIAEYTERVDAIVLETRDNQIKQTYVRFNALDKDKNGEMSFDEYQASGHRSFSRWDTDEDGYVSMDDPEPESEDLAQH